MIKTAITFALGCVLFLQFPHLPSIHWLWLSLLACFLLKLKHFYYLSIFLLAGLWTLLHAHLIINDRLAIELAGKDILISGTVSSVVERQSHKLKFEFKPDRSTHYTFPNKLRLSWYHATSIPPHAGEKWQLLLRLKPIHGMKNQGAFDYETWLFEHGVGATGYVRTSTNNIKLKSAPFYSINSLRQSLTKYIETTLPNSKNIGLIQGLTSGIKHNITQQQWQVLRLSGTNHLLAISGLHIGLAATIGFFICRFLWSLRADNLLRLTATKSGAIGGVLVALFYAALAGFSLPTQRALIMVATVMISLLLARPLLSSHILAISLLLVLIFDPISVLSPGFWLSFSAVGIILFLSQNRYPPPKWQWLKIHTFIAFGLSPILLLFFMETSIIAPVANFVSIPFISVIVVPLLLLASLCSWLYSPLAIELFHLADILLTLFWPLLETLSSLSLSHWQSPQLPFYYWIAIMLGCLLLLTPRYFPAKWIGIIGLLPLFIWSPNKPNKGDFWFTLLDVGQGLSSVIQTQHHTLVFDTGPKFSDSFNPGNAIVKPFLQAQGIKHIDTLVVSHGDNDHIGGAIPLVNEIKTTTILSSTPQLLPNAKSCHSMQSWQWDNVSFSIIHPNRSDSGSENNLSCVLKISNDYGSVLLSGDIEKQAEQQIVQRYGSNLHVKVLVAPHHGSKTSSSIDFINAVSPDFALFPIGYQNRYHFPHDSVTKRYKHKGITLLNSAEHGAIQFKFDAIQSSNPTTWRQSNHKMWSSD